MNESLHGLVCGDEEFLLEASQAAQRSIAVAIRRALRAVAVQALKQRLQNRSPSSLSSTLDETDEARYHHNNRIILTQRDIHHVQEYCLQLAKRWSQANVAMGNEQIATTIVDIAQRESATLYLRQDHHHGGDDDDDDINNNNSNSRVEDATSDNLSTTEEITTNPPTPPPPQQQIQQQIYATPYARIRSLPARPLGDAIATLDRLGSRHRTYWTVSWRIVQAAAVQIPYRLYKNAAAEEVIEIIPASRAQPDDDTPKRKAVDWLVDRKRKSVGRERLPPKRVKLTSSDKTVQSVPPPPPPPRPPTSVSSCQWTIQEVQQSFDASQRKYLDKLVIGGVSSEKGKVDTADDNNKEEEEDDDDEEESSPPSMMIGSLMELGHFHHYQQSGIDYSEEDGPRVTDLAKRKRLQRRSKKERLADHVEADTDYGATAKRASCSKVVQCKDTTERKWRDLDVQQCWVEVFDGTTRRVLAFDTLEMLLLDEDEASEGWHDEEY